MMQPFRAINTWYDRVREPWRLLMLMGFVGLAQYLIGYCGQAGLIGGAGIYVFLTVIALTRL